jgi:hypothetical protein
LAGTAVTPTNHILNWNAVVKLLRSPAGMIMPDGTQMSREIADAPQHFGYWQRERLFAQSELPNNLPSGLRSPRFLGITSINENECWLWQEYLKPDSTWTWDDYREAAYRLGKWQASAHKACDQYLWLSRRWMTTWVHGPLTRIFGMTMKTNVYQQPLITACFSLDELHALQQLWENRQTILDRLAHLPQTMCHLDAHRGNLNWAGDKLALLDWAFVGSGAIGEELAAFVGATLLLDYVPLADADRLEQAAFAGYIAGLRAAGWSGDEALIWDAYRCAMPLRYAHMSVASMVRTALQPNYATEWEQKTGKSLDDILAHRAGLVRFYLSRVPRIEEFGKG